MATSIIRNKVGTKKLTMYVPSGSTEAGAFASAVLDGTYDILQHDSTAGSDAVTEAEDVTVFFEDDTTKKRGYLNFIAKTTKSEEDIISALVGKTYNGIKADKVVIISMRTVAY